MCQTWTETRIEVQLFVLALCGCTCMLVCVFVRSCTYFLQPCGQPVVAAVGGTAGRLITESEETSHPPPLFLPGPKWSEARCNTHTHSWMSYKTKLKKGLEY